MSLSSELEDDERRQQRRQDRQQSERETRRAGAPERPGVSLDGDRASIVLPEGAGLTDINGLIRSRGLDPDEWVVESVRVNEWEALAYGGGPDGEPRVVTLHQLRVFLRNLAASVKPAPAVPKRLLERPGRRRTGSGTVLVAVVGDQHAPYHDVALHRAFLGWLRDVRPQKVVSNGDLLDLPSVSRFRTRRLWNASVSECVKAGGIWLREAVEASPDTLWVKLRGNHEQRTENTLIDRAPELADVVPAFEPEGAPHMFSMRRLLHLDDLGVELIGDEREDFARIEYEIAPGVSVRHEPPRAERSRRMARGIIAGHDHRQAITHETAFDAAGEPYLRTVVHVGAMADTSSGLGYAIDPNWQRGFATAAVYADGAVSYDLATWDGASLTWRGDRWS